MGLSGLRGKNKLRACAVAVGLAALLFSNVSNAEPLQPLDAAQCPPPGAPPPPGPTGSQCQGTIVSDTTTLIKKAKVTISLPPVQLLIYVNSTTDWPVIVPVTPGEPYVTSVNPSYVVSPPGSPQPYGIFQPIKVKALAFGSVPVAAEVQLRQHQEHGVISPIASVVRGSGGPFQRPRDHLRMLYIQTPHASALLDITVSHVTVDGTPLDVGPNCHTASPATLVLTAQHGYNVSGAPIANWWWQPIQSNGGGGYPYGTVDVPAFTDCHNGADDLDPLLTAMISGPDNPVTARQWAGAIDPSKLPPLDDKDVLAAKALSISELLSPTAGPGSLPRTPPSNTSPATSAAFQAWMATYAGLPQNPSLPPDRRGVGLTVRALYSFFLSDLEYANYFPPDTHAADRQDACTPLQNDAAEMYMAVGGTIKSGTTTYTASTISPDPQFNSLMLAAADAVRTLGAQCSANPATGDFAGTMAKVQAARNRASALGVDPLWTDPPPKLDEPH